MTDDINILYLVHDVCDPSIEKRIRMLKDGGAVVRLVGFYRGTNPPKEIAGCPVITLGRTYNGRFIQRLFSVMREALYIHRYRSLFAEADIILARNMEMLAIAVSGVQAGMSAAPVAYECLDIHRLLLKPGIVGKLFRRIEGKLSENASALITSSPAFINAYFKASSLVNLPVLLVENKVYAPGINLTGIPVPRTPGPPWRIGWFGALRCKKSLRTLADLAASSNGKVEVIMRGRPAYDQLEDFDKIVAETPGLHFLGPYKNPDDLEAIYTQVHFTWAIDRYEEGLNSSWLLPNRLYEGGLYHCVPIAQENVETGRLIKRLGIGVTITEPADTFLASFFHAITPQHYELLAQEAAHIPLSTWLADTDECKRFVEYLASLERPRNLANPAGRFYAGQDDIVTAL